jgi:DNA-3-methyladenine glycosylase II
MSSATIVIELPAGYDRAHALAFHGRDAGGPAEQVAQSGETAQIRKGVLLDGVPVLFDLRLHADRAECNIDAGPHDADRGRVQQVLANMLGLRIDPAAFARMVEDDALFGPLVRRQPDLRVIQSATVFEALTWAVIGQQINLPFAISLRRSFIEQAGRPHPSGLWCYPEAADAARLDIEQLTSRKFSRAKAETLLRLAHMVADGELDLENLMTDGDVERAGASLLAVKGIGPWTVNYALLRGYAYQDCSLHGDVAVRTAIGRLLGENDVAKRPAMREAEAFLQAYRPQRTMAAAYCWASLSQVPR